MYLLHTCYKHQKYLAGGSFLPVSLISPTKIWKHASWQEIQKYLLPSLQKLFYLDTFYTSGNTLLRFLSSIIITKRSSNNKGIVQRFSVLIPTNFSEEKPNSPKRVMLPLWGGNMYLDRWKEGVWELYLHWRHRYIFKATCIIKTFACFK